MVPGQVSAAPDTPPYTCNFPRLLPPSQWSSGSRGTYGILRLLVHCNFPIHTKYKRPPDIRQNRDYICRLRTLCIHVATCRHRSQEHKRCNYHLYRQSRYRIHTGRNLPILRFLSSLPLDMRHKKNCYVYLGTSLSHTISRTASGQNHYILPPRMKGNRSSPFHRHTSQVHTPHTHFRFGQRTLCCKRRMMRVCFLQAKRRFQDMRRRMSYSLH